ncbi:MAG TPA: type II secretion system F family protein [Symbiobacteriaceae bacterium]|nr:type II secretion system F family protein [Symbiobacteriaceae bacterium]
MKLPLFLIAGAAAVALLVYWAARRFPLPEEPEAPPRRRTLLSPLEEMLERDLQQAGLKVTGSTLVRATVCMAGLGALAASPFQNRPLMLIGAVTLGALPLQFVRSRIRQRGRIITRAAEPALVAIARLCEVRRHPFLAITDALPMLQPPLRAEFELALSQTQAGLPLADALRMLAVRCCDNFYLHQLAELVAINIRQGGDLSGGLERLAARLRTMEELRAEELAELFGYRWLTRLLLAASVLPLPYWLLTGAPSLQVYLTEPLARGLLVWVVVSGLAIASLPYWLTIDD